MLVRALTQSDTPHFQSIRLAGLQEAPASFASSYEDERDHSRDEFARYLLATEDQVVFGAFVDDQLVGVAGVRREARRKYRHKAFLWGVYVRPDSRGIGASKMLLQEAIRFAKHMSDVTQINLTVTANNAIAGKLYASLGFKEFGREPDSLFAAGILHDEIHMALKFSNARS